MGYQSLEYSYEEFYKEQNFHDFEIQASEGQWINQSLLRRLSEDFHSEYPAIQLFNFRLIMGSSYNISKGSNPITGPGRVIGYNISVPVDQQINQLSLKKGKAFSTSDGYPNITDEYTNKVIVNNQFAKRVNLEINDTVYLNFLDRTELSVRGIAFSPEYVVVIPSKWGSIFPINQYGIFFMPLSNIQTVFNLTGKVNNILLKFKSETTEQKQNQIIEDYFELISESLNVSLLDPVSSKYQISNWFIRLNINGFKEIAQFLPFLVLLVAILTIFITFNRLIYHQKNEIGVFLSLGYTPNDILFHYSVYMLSIATIGGLLGIVVGVLFTQVVASFFGAISSIPDISVKMDEITIIYSCLLGYFASIIGGFYPAWVGSRLNPKEAISNSNKMVNIGKYAKFSSLDRLHLNIVWKLLIRNSIRNGWRSLTNIIGAASTMIILFLSFTLIISASSTIETEFSQIRDYDLEVSFTRPKLGDLTLYQEIGKLEEIKDTYGIETYDCVLEIPVKYFSGDMKKSNEGVLIGFNSTTPNTHNFNWNKKFSDRWENPESSIVLTSGLVNYLGIEGKEVNEIVVNHPRIISLEEELWLRLFYLQNGKNLTLNLLKEQFNESSYLFNYNSSTQLLSKNSRISIGGVSKELWGTVNYVSLEKMSTLLGLSLFTELGIDLTPVSKIFIKLSSHGKSIQSQVVNDLLHTLNDVQSILTIENVQEGIKAYLQIFNVLILLLIIVAIIISILSISTTVFLNIHERKKELLTMQILGSSDREIIILFSSEYLILTLFGLILGIPFGFQLTEVIVNTMFPIMVYFQTVFELNSLIFIFLMILFTSLVTQFPALRSLFKLELSLISKEFIG